MTAKQKLGQFSVDTLVEMFEAHSLAQYTAIKRIDVATFNRHADRLFVLYDEIIRRGGHAWERFLPLLCNGNAQVRYNAAAFLLRFDTAQAVPVLEQLGQYPHPEISFNADMTLKLWRQGEFPPKDEPAAG